MSNGNRQAPRSWLALTRALDDASSPVRQAVDRLLSNGDGVRSVQREYRTQAGPLLVDSSGANGGTIGTAMDLMLRWAWTQAPAMGMAVRGAAALGPGPRAAALALIESVGGTVPARRSGNEVVEAPMTAGVARDAESLARTCWALALFVEVFRLGWLSPGSPLVPLETAQISDADAYLALASDGAVAELVALSRVADASLLPRLAARSAPWVIGPTFSGSALLDADADLIAGGLLLEVKTNLGGKQKDGTRRPALLSETLRQVVGYVLHDLDDEFELTDVALYDARYGYFVEWPLVSLLRQVAGSPVDLAAERGLYARLLRTGSSI